MCDPNDRRSSEGLSARLKPTVVMSICGQHAFQNRWIFYLYTFTWTKAKKCMFFSQSEWIPDPLRRFSLLSLVHGLQQISSRTFRQVFGLLSETTFAKRIPFFSVRFGLCRRHFIPLVLKLAGLAPFSSPGFLIF